MKKSKKQHYKILGAVLTVLAIFGLGTISMNTDLLMGKLSLQANIEELNVDELATETENVQANEEVEIKIGKLPEDWEINLSYYLTPNIETVIGSTNTEHQFEPQKFIPIVKVEDATFLFHAPEQVGLYKVALYDKKNQLQGLLVKLNVYEK